MATLERIGTIGWEVKLDPTILRTVYWTAGVISLICILCISRGLDMTDGTARRLGIKLIWICSSVLVAAAMVVLLLATHT